MINVAVAGIGVWGKNVARNFYHIPEANLVFCYDADPSCIEWVRKNFPEVRIADNYGQIVTNHHIDAVIIATPAPTHFELARKALQAGKNVLVEKPLALNSHHAAGLVSLSRKGGRKLMVGHLLKYHPAVQEMRTRIRAGELGNIYYIHSQRLGLGRVREVENAMWCLAIHDIYTAVYLLDRYPERVRAVGKSFLQKGKGIEDVVFLDLFFQGEVIAHAHVSWVDPEKRRRTTVVGEKKMMVFDEIAPLPQLKVYDKGINVEQDATGFEFKIRGGNEATPPIEQRQPLKEECRHFIECVREDKTPLTDGEEGLGIVKVLEAAQKSLKRGCPVEVKSK